MALILHENVKSERKTFLKLTFKCTKLTWCLEPCELNSEVMEINHFHSGNYVLNQCVVSYYFRKPDAGTVVEFFRTCD